MSNSKRFSWPVRPIALAENIIRGEKYRFTVLTERLIRMEYDAEGIFEDRASQTSFYRDFKKARFSKKTDGNNLIIETDYLLLEYNENSEFSDKTLSVRLKNEPGTQWHYSESYEDLGGTVKTLDTINGRLPFEGGLCSHSGFTVLDDTARMILDENGWVDVRRDNTIDCYFFGYGYDYINCIKDFYRLTGAPPMLPAYALGNWWSRYHKYTQQEYTELVNKFKQDDIPFSVGVVDMDWHITKIPEELETEGCSSGWTGYTWNKELFPNYKEFLKFLKDSNLKTALNLHPADGVRRHEDMYEQMAKACGVDPQSGARVPFDILSQNFMENYFDILHHPYEKDGVDFWWMDWQQGNSYWWIHEENKNGKFKDKREILDPLWLLNHLHILDISRNGKRPMFFSRYAGPGSQRYSVGFSGDTFVTWDSLAFQPEFTATASNIGYSWWSHDIGGHMGGYRDDELTTRWVQLGVFSPINRLHSTDSEFQRKEPWCYGAEYQPVLEHWLRLRHKLFPYIYTMNYRTHSELLPLVQPMYYSYPKCSGAYDSKKQFMFGSELMVAPITEKRSETSRLGKAELWLPNGKWFDLFTGTLYESKNKFGRKMQVFRDLNNYPVFAKSGAILPMTVRTPHDNRLVNSDKMSVIVFPGNNNCFELYEDEGEYNNFENGKFVKTKLELKWGKTAKFIIHPACGDCGLIPEVRSWQINLRGFNSKISLSVLVNGNPVETSVIHCTEINTFTVSVKSPVTDLIEVEVTGENLINDNSDSCSRIMQILQLSQIEIPQKEEILKVLNNRKFNCHRKIVEITGKSLKEQPVIEAIKEQLTLTDGEFDKSAAVVYQV